MRAVQAENTPGRGGLAVWLAQRVTGLFLVYALIVHLWAVHGVASGRLTWAVITARLAGDTAWTIYYVLFIPAVVAHAALGVWSVVLDYNPGTALRRSAGWLLWAGSLALLAYGYLGIRPLL